MFCFYRENMSKLKLILTEIFSKGTNHIKMLELLKDQNQIMN